MNLEGLIQIWEKNQWGFYKDEPYGVVGFDGELTVQRLQEAYSTGVFPWPQNGELIWFCPTERGVLDFSDFHVNKRLARKYRNSGCTFTMNQAFAQVIQGCASTPRRGQTGTWITPQLIQAYEKFFEAGCVLTFECWWGGRLVGGLYGVMTYLESQNTSSGQMLNPLSQKLTPVYFSAESVFGSLSDTSKYCLIYAVEHLQSLGLKWMDIQMVTRLTEALGGRNISRELFLKRILKA